VRVRTTALQHKDWLLKVLGREEDQKLLEKGQSGNKPWWKSWEIEKWFDKTETLGQTAWRNQKS